jgi:hypothetical protein
MDSRVLVALGVAIGIGGCGGAVEAPLPDGRQPGEAPGHEEVTATSAAVTGQPLTLGPDDTWTWYDQVPGARCADGSPTGFAVNPHRSGSGKLLVFLDGGGMCDDATSCTAPFKTATHTSYGATDFAAEMTSASSKSEQVNLAPFGSYTWDKTLGARGIWDRTAASNPFRAYDFVFVPYCTADAHTGARQDTSSALSSARVPSNEWFVGFTNFGIFAREVQALFPSPPSVALVGGSAGGFGTLYNYPQLKALYPSVPMTVIADSGIPFWAGDEGFSPRQGFWLGTFAPPGVPSYEEDWMADAWGLDATHPVGVHAVTRTGARRSIYPMQSALVADALETSDAFGLLEGSNDWVTPWYLHLDVNGLGHPNVADGQADLDGHVTAVLSNVHTHWMTSTQDPNPNLRIWNQHHGFLLDDVGTWTQSGVLPWLASQFAL